MLVPRGVNGAPGTVNGADWPVTGAAP